MSTTNDKALEAFYEACKRHDWTYEYSDDFSVWQRGQNARRKLLATLEENKEDPRFRRIYVYWHNRYFKTRQLDG